MPRTITYTAVILRGGPDAFGADVGGCPHGLPGIEDPAKPKNQTANASPARATEMIITRSSTPLRRSTARSPRIERVQPGW